MPETPQQYTQRILNFSQGQDALKIQRTTPRRLGTLLKRVSKKAAARRPAAGKWSIAEIIAHLADAELVGGWRMRQILAANGTAIQAFDQDVWASTFQYAKRDAAKSLEVFRVLRENNLALLKSVPKNLWNNYGMHSERGQESIAHIVKMFAGHDLNHLSQVEAIVKQGR